MSEKAKGKLKADEDNNKPKAQALNENVAGTASRRRHRPRRGNGSPTLLWRTTASKRLLYCIGISISISIAIGSTSNGPSSHPASLLALYCLASHRENREAAVYYSSQRDSSYTRREDAAWETHTVLWNCGPLESCAVVLSADLDGVVRKEMSSIQPPRKPQTRNVTGC